MDLGNAILEDVDLQYQFNVFSQHRARYGRLSSVIWVPQFGQEDVWTQVNWAKIQRNQINIAIFYIHIKVYMLLIWVGYVNYY